ncbi:MAG: hypothetical protein H7Y38_18530 [Armatimonadetes bacterium]|nr:hypothetical protein [Armatimonadota bacterium]
MMFTRFTAFVFTCVLVSVASAGAQTPKVDSLIAPATAKAKPAPLPPLPAGVTHVEWNQFIKTPVGDYGLELTDEIKALNGKKVRLLGYMVMRDEPTPGTLLLAPYQVGIEEHEAGFADLPPQTVYVTIPYNAPKIVPHTPRPLLLTGTLSVGQKVEDDGKFVSLFRLALDAPPVRRAKPVKPAAKPQAKPVKPAPKISAPKPKTKTR